MEKSTALKAGKICSIALCAAAAIVALVFVIVFFASELKIKTLQIAVTICAIALLTGIAALTIFIYNSRVLEKKKTRTGVLSTKNIARIAIMTALSYALYMFVKVNLPIFPSFLDLQISDLPALLCGFMMGPASGCLVIFFKVLLKLPFSSTFCVGELGDLFIGVAFVLPASLIYKYNKTRLGAIIGLLTGFLASTGVAILVNWLILIPAYVSLMFGGSWAPLLGMCRALYPEITEANFFFWYLLGAILPFNLLRGAITALLTFLVYKSLGRMFDKIVPKSQNKVQQPEQQPEQYPDRT